MIVFVIARVSVIARVTPLVIARLIALVIARVIARLIALVIARVIARVIALVIACVYSRKIFFSYIWQVAILKQVFPTASVRVKIEKKSQLTTFLLVEPEPSPQC